MPHARWHRRATPIAACLPLLGSPNREVREYASPYRKPTRIPSARASGFPGTGTPDGHRHTGRAPAHRTGTGSPDGHRHTGRAPAQCSGTGTMPHARWHRRATPIAACLPLLVSPNREVREYASPYRKPTRIPSARASGFPGTGTPDGHRFTGRAPAFRSPVPPNRHTVFATRHRCNAVGASRGSTARDRRSSGRGHVGGQRPPLQSVNSVAPKTV
jgi:hypothetical protein